MTYKRISVEQSGRRCTVTLNRPEKRNALDDTTIAELRQALSAAERADEVRVVVLTGSGSAFCAGVDMEYLSKLSTYGFEENKEDSLSLMRLFSQIYTLRKPVIAKVRGPAIAGGCGLVTVCDFALAAEETARFSYSEVHIGFLPAIVMVFLIKRIGEGKTRELILTGKLIDAKEAEKIGLITKSLPDQMLDDAVDSLAQELSDKNSPASMARAKEMFSKLDGLNLIDALDYAANMNALARMTEDFKKGLKGFLEKNPTQW
jgi:methylglutaconyl-CoA hydratase